MNKQGNQNKSEKSNINNSRKKYNILFITIDALGAKYVSHKTTPNIQKIVDSSIVFERSFSFGPTSMSGICGIFTGTNPLRYEGGYKYIAPSRKTLSGIFKKNGYTTVKCSISNMYIFWRAYGRDFTDYEDLFIPSKFFIRAENMERKGKEGVLSKLYTFIDRVILNNCPFVTADKLTQKVVSWMEKNKREPFFFWIHYADLHGALSPGPVNEESKLKRIKRQMIKDKARRSPKDISKAEREYLMDFYYRSLKRIDSNIGKIWELKERGLLNDTIICITADHGEAFGETFEGEPSYFHGLTSFGKVYGMIDALLHVPLIFYHPHLPKKRIKKLCSTMDIPPTLTELAGIEIEKGIFDGENLLKHPFNDNDVVLSAVALNQNPGKIPDQKDFVVSIRANKYRYTKYFNKDKEGIRSLNGEDHLKEARDTLKKELMKIFPRGRK